MYELLEAASARVDAAYACPHPPPDSGGPANSLYRKPAPGMLLAAATDLKLDLAASWMIGDQPRDAEAGRAAGCRTILFSHPTNRAVERKKDPDHTVDSFAQAVEVIEQAVSQA